MRKLFVLLISLVLFMLALTSCGTPKSAEALMDKIDKKMDSLKSYQTDMTAKLSTEMYGYRVLADFTGKDIKIIGNAGRYYNYMIMEGSMEMKDEKNETIETVKTKDLRAFHEGNMFIWAEQNGLTQKLYSSLSKDEYIAYLEKQDGMIELDFESCVNSSFVKNEDKSWTLTYSGYTKKAIDELIKAFGDEIFEEDIEDMEITVHANADFTVKDVEIKMIFENESTTSEFSIKQEYSKYEKAMPIVDTLDISQYREISDCRLLTDINDMLEDLEELENGSFVLDITQKFSTSSPAYKQTNTERDTVSYGKKDGKYFYDIKASTDNTKYDIAYANGKQTITVAGQTQTADQTEKDAKAFIGGLINTVKYEAIRVSDIKKLEDGTYQIRCDKPNDSLYSPVFSSLGTSPQRVSQTIDITVQDGKITKIESTLSASGFTMYYGNVSFELTSVCEFYY
jgi:hypothetical protein